MNALALAILIASAPDGGVPIPPARAWDHPVALADGGTLPPGVFFPQPTYDKLNEEMERLQSLGPVTTRQEVGVDWLLISAGVGVVIGLVTGFAISYVLDKMTAK